MSEVRHFEIFDAVAPLQGQAMAARVRQRYRAYLAKDDEALDVCTTYICEYMPMYLNTLLKHVGPEWGTIARWIDSGLYSANFVQTADFLHVRDQLNFVYDDKDGYYDPFEYEIQLNKQAFDFRSYGLRFGDNRPLSEKLENTALVGEPSGGWKYEIEKYCNTDTYHFICR